MPINTVSHDQQTEHWPMILKVLKTCCELDTDGVLCGLRLKLWKVKVTMSLGMMASWQTRAANVYKTLPYMCFASLKSPVISVRKFHNAPHVLE